jgi:hypothetical protein
MGSAAAEAGAHSRVDRIAKQGGRSSRTCVAAGWQLTQRLWRHEVTHWICMTGMCALASANTHDEYCAPAWRYSQCSCDELPKTGVETRGGRLKRRRRRRHGAGGCKLITAPRALRRAFLSSLLPTRQPAAPFIGHAQQPVTLGAIPRLPALGQSVESKASGRACSPYSK